MGDDWQPAPPAPSALLLKLRGNSESGLSMAGRALAQGSELLLEIGYSDQGGDPAVAEQTPSQWVRIEAGDNPWEQAHSMMRMGFAAGTGDLISAEPDFEQQWVSGPPAAKCIAEPQDGSGGRAVGTHSRWHLDSQYSGLDAARTAVPKAAQQRVLIAHVDTGYDPAHKFAPAHIQPGQRNFVKEDGAPNNATDVTPTGGFLRNYGHGTGTVGILAAPTIGGAPDVRVLPIRIANSVVRFKTSTMAQGFDYALAAGAHILSMSMGGLASAILADVVNKCYAGGLVMVAAAGNNFSGLPIRSIVYPARMRRVVAACGIMANLKPYYGLGPGTMQGCYGPDSKMRTALAGFTPNIPWPEIGCPNIIDEDGQGTSAATPQIAAAAALWLAQHWQSLQPLPAWQRGEAVRQALFKGAVLGLQANPDPKLGWGALRAHHMLALTLAQLGPLTPEKPASASWDWLKLLTGRGTGFAASGLSSADRLMGLELTQLAQRDPDVAKAIADPDDGEPTRAARKRFLEAAEASNLASRTLRQTIGVALRSRVRRDAQIQPPPIPAQGAPLRPSSTKPPSRRRLRIFALDPSLGGALNSYEDQIATVDVRNEPNLQPGPVGEYLEVVDADPASNRFYPPIDLNDPNLLLQDGATPSEGDPCFHQQMVYAVAMRTIEHFEIALGRKALWASQWSGQTGAANIHVPRLRIYPHALRQENAYYSPDRKALLFGYFPANSRVSDLTPPGTMVFSCLSADIVAHETTHALLDGQARTFREPSNPDVRSFHEAFADIVALFQQFTYRDLVKREIGRARGNLSASAMLGGLARQFGEGTGKAGPLRSYPNLDPELSYEKTFATHARGSLLVAAVYRAFLAIVERRTADLVRIATGGTGELPPGAIHPDLVERLADETTKSARHVLNMCIRAIDYCPPVDITFGEYLRAIITADVEQIPVDAYGYRVAFLEAFRRLQLLPRSLRTVSVDTLSWRPWGRPPPRWLKPAIDELEINLTARFSRDEIFAISEKRRDVMRRAMVRGLHSGEEYDVLGLQHRLKFFRSLQAKGYQSGTTFMVDNLRVASRVRDDGELSAQIVAVVRQRRPECLIEGAFNSGNQDVERFWFRGGATLIIDLLDGDGPNLRYVIRKPIQSPSRLARERAYRRGDTGDALRSMYFGNSKFAAREPFAVMHASRE
jgi:hypothetical protein